MNLGDRAFVHLTVENLDSGEMVVSTESARPFDLRCIDEQTCDLVPRIVGTGGLADSTDLDNLHILVTVEAMNEMGDSATASMDGYLRRR